MRRQCGQKVILQPMTLDFILHTTFPEEFFISLTLFLFFLAAVTGYQHPSESASGHASQFYISLLDSSNKEQRLDEKGKNQSCEEESDE